MSLDQFFELVDSPARSLVVVNRSEPEPVQRLLESLFANQDVNVDATSDETYPPNTVLLLEDGVSVAQSTLESLMETVLLVNSDIYTTGARDLTAVTLPDVLSKLENQRFTVQGYPRSKSEKLLLITISRLIERRAFETGSGTLRSSFQQLSRIRDEKGTNRVYRSLGDTDVDVHVYGTGDDTDVGDIPVTVHAGGTYPYRSSWFVVFSNDADGSGMALLALQEPDKSWDGFWTTETTVVSELDQFIATQL